MEARTSKGAWSKVLNVIVWTAIGLLAALVGAWTIWASHQPDRPSLWAPE